MTDRQQMNFDFRSSTGRVLPVPEQNMAEFIPGTCDSRVSTFLFPDSIRYNRPFPIFVGVHVFSFQFTQLDKKYLIFTKTCNIHKGRTKNIYFILQKS